MFNLQLDAHEVLQLGKILINAAGEEDDGEAISLYHRLIKVIEKEG
jgi:hypothetical protein